MNRDYVTKWKHEQDTERGIPASQGLVRRASPGVGLFSWKCGAEVGGGREVYRNTG
jgi:hypothetical protein